MDQYIAANEDLLLGDPPDLSQEAPFDVDQTPSGSGDTPRVLENLPGVNTG